jgi:hypothetical protein
MKSTTQSLCHLALVATLVGACAAPAPTAPSRIRAQAESQDNAAGQDVDAAGKQAPAKPTQPKPTPPKPSQPPVATRPSPKPTHPPVPTHPAPQPEPTAYPGDPYPGGYYPGPGQGRYYPAPGQGGYYPGPGYYPAPGYDPYPNDGARSAAKITRVWTDGISADRFTVHWTTTAPTLGIVEWGTDNLVNRSAWQSPADTYHSYTLTGLTPATEYHYRVTTRAANGTAVRSPEMRETTSGEAATPKENIDP